MQRGRAGTAAGEKFEPPPCTFDGWSMLAVHDASGEIKIVASARKQKVTVGPGDKHPLGYVYFAPSAAPPKYARCSPEVERWPR